MTHRPFLSSARFGPSTLACAAALCLHLGASTAFAQTRFSRTNLVSDQPGVAAVQDPNLVNAWGLSNAPGGPFWISDNGSGLTTIYGTAGNIVPLVVTVPPPGGSAPGTTSAPTGQIYSAGQGFHQASGATSVFTFATEDGTVSSWNPSNGSSAVLSIDRSGQGSVFKGLASAQNGSTSELYVADFHNNAVDTFNTAFAPVSNAGFVDPSLPAGYAPFNIANLGGKIAVSYAEQNAQRHDDVAGAGHGYVDLYNPDGTFSQRLISAGTLNSPWAMTLAPAGFGSYGGDLLVGNFGDGQINAFNPTTGVYVGTLQDAAGNPLVIDGLWGLSFRSDAPGKLFFTAGPDGESHGLFGYVTSVPEPSASSMLILGLIPLLLVLRRRGDAF